MLAGFEGVTKRYGDREALSDLNLEVRRGEVLGLVGPNGAGKTTALRILCGLLAPSEGRATIGGFDLQADPLSARRLLGYVPDGAPLYANLSPRQHLRLVGRLHGIDEVPIRKETDRLLEALELLDRGDDPVGDFSRGMRQKAALACALLARPPLLVLDEPLSGLDAPTSGVVKALLKGWAREVGAVFYTSHLLEVVERVCDRIAVLADGKLRATGSLDELRQSSGEHGPLEDVFRTLTQTEDPESKARKILYRTV